MTATISRDFTRTGRAVGAHRAPPKVRNIRDIILVVASTGLANVVLYLFPAIVARTLAPVEFGLFSSLFGFVVFFGIVAGALQTLVAGQVATIEPSQRVGRLSGMAITTMRLTACAALVLATISPGIARMLHASSYGPALAASMVATTLLPWSVLLGIFQGLQRFKTLGFLTLLQAVGRLAATTVMLWTKDLTVLLAAVSLSAVFPLAMGWALLGPVRPRLRFTSSLKFSRRASGGVVKIATRVNHSDFGWTLLTVIALAFPTVGDVIVVRHVYPAHDAGLYAAVALVGRCVLFLPVGINAVLYPRYLITGSARARVRLRNQGLLITGALCLLAAGVLAADPGLTMRLVVGAGYEAAAGILRIYLFAAVAFALASNFSYYQLANANRRYALGVLVPYLLLICLLPVIFSSDLRSLAVAMLALAAALVAVSSIVSKMVDPS